MAANQCAVDGCTRVHEARGMCRYHYNRWNRYGHLDPVTPKRRTGADHPHWVEGTDVAYGTIHARIRRTRGSARKHTCIECAAQARQWSYDHTDPNELTDPRGMVYSADVNRYQPRCHSCHVRLDRAASLARKAVAA